MDAVLGFNSSGIALHLGIALFFIRSLANWREVADVSDCDWRSLFHRRPSWLVHRLAIAASDRHQSSIRDLSFRYHPDCACGPLAPGKSRGGHPAHPRDPVQPVHLCPGRNADAVSVSIMEAVLTSRL